MIPVVTHLAPNLTLVGLGSMDLAFSYETCIGFRVRGEDWVMSQNVWSQTTGRHINRVTSPAYPRTPYPEFCAALRRFDITVRQEQEA